MHLSPHYYIFVRIFCSGRKEHLVGDEIIFSDEHVIQKEFLYDNTWWTVIIIKEQYGLICFVKNKLKR